MDAEDVVERSGADRLAERSDVAHDGRSDADLMRLTLSGDEDAFAEIYRRHLPLLLRWCLWQTRNRELAADLSSEVFAEALVCISRYDERDGALLPWLLGIARNKLRESRKKGRIESVARARLSIQPLQLTDSSMERVEELASPHEELLAHVSRLPEEQRAALLARIVHERSYEQISEELSCSQAVVRQRVSRGLKTLREQVKQR